MKYLIIILFFCSILIACKKQDTAPDNGCIELPDLSKTSLSQQDINKVNAFLQANNITGTFIAQSYKADSVYTYGKPGYWNLNYKMSGYQFINNLPVLNGLIFWQDRANIKQYGIFPRLYNSINLDPTAQFKAADIRIAYLSILEKLHDPFLALPNAPYAGKNYKDSCLIIKYGYYDKSAKGNYLDPPNMVKAWEISPKSGTPLIRISDDTKELISGNYSDRLEL